MHPGRANWKGRLGAGDSRSQVIAFWGKASCLGVEGETCFCLQVSTPDLGLLLGEGFMEGGSDLLLWSHLIHLGVTTEALRGGAINKALTQSNAFLRRPPPPDPSR